MSIRAIGLPLALVIDFPLMWYKYVLRMIRRIYFVDILFRIYTLCLLSSIIIHAGISYQFYFVSSICDLHFRRLLHNCQMSVTQQKLSAQHWKVDTIIQSYKEDVRN
jgi:hypothetical protein